jgi:hypothetical protein
MNYKNKYVKYKKKYVNLKTQIGGIDKPAQHKLFNTFFSITVPKILLPYRTRESERNTKQQILKAIKTAYNSLLFKATLEEDKKIPNLTIEKNKKHLAKYYQEIFDRRIDFENELTKYKITREDLNKEKIDLNIESYSKKKCSEREFRLSKNPIEYCDNEAYRQFLGECSEPGIISSYKTKEFLSEEVSNKLIELLSVIQTKFIDNYNKVTLGIHVGGSSFCYLSELSQSQYNFNIYFDPNTTSMITNTNNLILVYSMNFLDQIEMLICKIQSIDLNNTVNQTESLALKIGFPLHINNKFDKAFIVKIIEISQQIYINFINAMCSSIFQTFYLLKNSAHITNFSYIECPEQNRGTTLSTNKSTNIANIIKKYQES